MSTGTPPDASPADAAAFTARDFRPGAIRHIVLFRFRDGTSDTQMDDVERRFRALAYTPRDDGLPYILSIDAGPQMSLEGAGSGFDRGFIVTFASVGDRNFYVGTPVVSDPRHVDAEHDAFKRWVAPLLAPDGVVVFDLTV
ncbi:Dabb family protein [Glaciihabitans sp. dw_435]|uniref:Dabb family protein n=1 Tax=Glaciihabitans sp. dw_435 TaxID=2720081 RepID=UPI0027DAD941|nr:Dabb family protein [Glaciihabitans sp. dw_435]